MDESIPARFERQVAQYPDHIAVCTNKGSVTYAQLNGRANRIARAILRRRGTGLEPIALLLENGSSMIAAILGALKAGKTYVPLDPSLPPNRLSYILGDTQVPLVWTNAQNVELAASLTQGHIEIENVDCVDSSLSGDDCDIVIPPDAAAWIIYTSGSTGQPKGVVQTHRNVLQFVRNYTTGLRLSHTDRLLLVFSCAVNAGAHELFSGLLNGASLYPFDVKTEGLTNLANWIADNELTTYSSVPTLFRHFGQALTGNESFPKLRFIKLVGEPVTTRELELYKANFSSDCFLINRFGSTETGTVCWYFIAKETPIDGALVPVGYAADGNEIMLLDEQRNRVGAGEIGEIAVKSAYLSPGYWNKPEITQTAFLCDPSDGGERIYLTGDLGRILSDGSLVHLGRKDFQVKIRGHRIETAEIEIALLSISGAKEVVVMVQEDAHGEPCLVAYVLVPDRHQLRTGILRRSLAERLPAYMIPSAFIILENLPLAPNGKINRRELPKPDWSRPEVDRPFVAPRTSTEQQVANIWSEVLCVRPLGVDDDFLELGGHSLAAAQIVARLNERFQSDLSVPALLGAPTVALLAELLDSVTTNEFTSPIKKRSDTDLIPLSFTQQQLWFIDRLNPGIPSYNVARAFRFNGPLNVRAFEQSLDEIVRRHDLLRTRFPAPNEVPAQVIALSANSCSLTVVDVCDELTRVLHAEACRPFDLVNGPLVRFRLLRLNDEEHVFIVTMHHIVTDGWSLGVFVRELSSLYGAFAAAMPSPLPALPIQYADFACWQHETLRLDRIEARLDYWRKHLAGAPAILELPTDYPRSAAQTLRSASESATFSPELARKLKAFTQKEGVTLFMTLLAAVNALLFRLTGQEDVVVGSAIAGRNRTELEGLIGLFINTLPLRTDMSGDPTFRELLGRVRETALAAYANQEVPFDKLLERVPSLRAHGHSTLFQVLFILQDETSQDLSLPGIAIREIPVETGKLDSDLYIGVLQNESVLKCRIAYRTDLFESETIRRMLEQLQTLVDVALTNPDLPISALPILSDSERENILLRWNQTEGEYPRNKCIHALIEDQAERTPDAMAVIFHEQRLTYRELDQQANQLAHFLRASGVRPGVLVGILMTRSLGMIVSVLATLKSGAAYVPLDPNWPGHRIKGILDETEVPVVLSEQRLSDFITKNGRKVFALDSEWNTIAQQPPTRLQRSATADDLVYVIYTSGSTGRPKGVEVGHRALVNFATSTCATFELKPTDRVLQFTSLSFDTSAEEIFPTLMSGSTLVLRTDSMLDSTSKFLDECRDSAITVLGLPTAYWHELAETLFIEPKPFPPSLRLVVIGGERIIPERLEQWQKRAGRVRLVNRYGPTEATVSVTSHEVSGAVAKPRREVPIGRPIPNVQIYMLDGSLNPVPVGVYGELCVGGMALAKGYHKRSELTAEKFVPNPFSKIPGDRLYRTGDRARYLADGTIEFAGRMDDQVKVRGFRIELGEIEAVLDEHTSIRQAVVLAVSNDSAEKRLVSYVVPAAESQITAQELRSYVRTRLPDYMAPAAFVFLEEFPLTPNGKIDRLALRSIEFGKVTEERSCIAPRDAVEEMLVEIWESVLATRPISVEDDFFALGGHSLLAANVISRIKAATGTHLPFTVLFHEPTIERLAAVIRHTLGK